MRLGFARRPPSPPALEHGAVVEVGGVRVRLRVNPRARRVSLRLDARRGEMVATAPTPRRLPEAVAFANARADWILTCVAAAPAPSPLRPGLVISLEGAPLRLERAAMRIAPRLAPAVAGEPRRLIASGEGEAYGRAALRALKALAVERLTERTDVYAARLGRPTPKIGIGDPKSRWGSCRCAHGAVPALIRYSWRLILAPPAVLDYVAAHECAHLVEPNHGPAFWELVRRLNGDPARERAWLRRHGRSLHAVGP
jgi:predicted metal-dependent hydrolase